MTTLGDRLNQNNEREKQAAYNSAAALEMQRTEEARRQFQIVTAFFKEARDYFTQAILSGMPAKDMYVQLGGHHYTASGVNSHQAAADVIDVYQYTKQGPNSLYDPKKFSSLWHEFRQWAESEGMVATWHDATDGGGMDNWWVLRLNPRQQVLKRHTPA